MPTSRRRQLLPHKVNGIYHYISARVLHACYTVRHTGRNHCRRTSTRLVQYGVRNVVVKPKEHSTGSLIDVNHCLITANQATFDALNRRIYRCGWSKNGPTDSSVDHTRLPSPTRHTLVPPCVRPPCVWAIEYSVVVRYSFISCYTTYLYFILIFTPRPS